MSQFQDCPHCGKEIDLYEIQRECDLGDGDETETYCPHCEGSIKVSVMVVCHYTLEEGDEECPVCGGKALRCECVFWNS